MTSPLPLMPGAYDLAYDRLLTNVGRMQSEARVVPFWPLIGRKYDGSLMVIGRSVNGWIKDWSTDELTHHETRSDVVKTLRSDAETGDRCRMLWVTDLAGRTDHPYNTNRSAFWRVLRSIVAEFTGVQSPDWPSILAWTNLYKIAPAAGWNPAADLQRLQRGDVAALLTLELDALRPRRLLFLTGRNWVGPFAAVLELDMEWRQGLVEGVGQRGESVVVVARHPMGKPHAQFVSEVTTAFGKFGAG